MSFSRQPVFDLVRTGMSCAVMIGAAAAVTDSRSGTIPNWITLPPIIVAPLAYGAAFGLEYGLQSVASAFVSGVAPYLLYRQRAMGGGDVKLFAALGAVTGFDPLVGVQIQLTAFAIAMFITLCRQAWRGRLLATLACAAAVSLNRILPVRYKLGVSDELRTTVRMGGAVLLATVTSSLPHFLRLWGADS